MSWAAFFLGTSALTATQLDRSRGMMERLGMRQEGFYRGIAYFDEVWHDQYLYAMLAPEWISAA